MAILQCIIHPLQYFVSSEVRFENYPYSLDHFFYSVLKGEYKHIDQIYNNNHWLI